MLLTTSKDKYCKIWTEEGEIVAALNVNHPLPTEWDLGLKKQNTSIKKAMYAIKLLDIIAKRHKNIFAFGKDKNININ